MRMVMLVYDEECPRAFATTIHHHTPNSDPPPDDRVGPHLRTRPGGGRRWRRRRRQWGWRWFAATRDAKSCFSEREEPRGTKDRRRGLHRRLECLFDSQPRRDNPGRAHPPAPTGRELARGHLGQRAMLPFQPASARGALRASSTCALTASTCPVPFNPRPCGGAPRPQGPRGMSIGPPAP